MDNTLYYYVGLMGCYVILTAFMGSKFLTKIGRTRVFWLLLVLFFNFYLFAIVLIVPSFRKKLDLNEIKKVIVFEIIYVSLIILPIAVAAIVGKPSHI
jgi:hypothetical protein